MDSEYSNYYLIFHIPGGRHVQVRFRQPDVVRKAFMTKECPHEGHANSSSYLTYSLRRRDNLRKLSVCVTKNQYHYMIELYQPSQ